MKAITDKQIHALANEAEEHGDTEMHMHAIRALNGNRKSRTICVDAIRAAQDMVDA